MSTKEQRLIELLKRAHIHLGLAAYRDREFREKLGKDAPDFIINSLADIEGLVSEIDAAIRSGDNEGKS